MVPGLAEFRRYAIYALRRGEWATSEVALNGMFQELQKLPNMLPWCEMAGKLFYDADFAMLADVVEYEFPVRFVTASDKIVDTK